MLEKKIIFLMLFGISTVGFAKKEEDLDLGLEPVYTESLDAESNAALNVQAPQTNNLVNQEVQVAEDAEQSLPKAKKKVGASNQPIYILNQASPTATNNNSASQVQKQATTVIEDSPIVDSRAEKMRKARQESEVHTEQKIVEKLESSRLEDERRRADVLFSDRFDKLNQQNQTVEIQNQYVPHPPPQAKVVVVPEPIVTAHEEVILKEPAKSRLIITEEKTEKLDKNNLGEKKTYLTGIFGLTEFPKAANVQGQLTTGFAIGVEYKTHLLMDVGFVYAQLQKKYPTVANIEQYTILGQLKYQFMTDVIKPFVGGAVSYNYRTFNEIYIPRLDTSTSYTLDTGLSAGALVEPFDDFGIGFEYRYMWNLTHKTDGFYPSLYSNGQPIDEMNYYVMSLVGRFTF